MGGKCQTTGPSVTGGFKSPSDGLYSKILLSGKHLFSASLI